MILIPNTEGSYFEFVPDGWAKPYCWDYSPRELVHRANMAIYNNNESKTKKKALDSVIQLSIF
jgi:hypothetical protein